MVAAPLATRRLGLLAPAMVAAAVVLVCRLSTSSLYGDSALETSFVSSSSAAPTRNLLNKRVEKAKRVTMYGTHGDQKWKFGHRMHIKNWYKYTQERVQHVPRAREMGDNYIGRYPNKDFYTQTLKLSFIAGEESLLTEQDIRDHFTTEEYEPDMIVVGVESWRNPTNPNWKYNKNPKWKHRQHGLVKFTYVHFPNNEMALKAEEANKDIPAIGKCSEVDVRSIAEHQWVRIRDGVKMGRWGDDTHLRPAQMMPYGDNAKEGYDEHWADFPEYGFDQHPVYPA